MLCVLQERVEMQSFLGDACFIVCTRNALVSRAMNDRVKLGIMVWIQQTLKTTGLKFQHKIVNIFLPIIFSIISCLGAQKNRLIERFF